MDYEDKGGAELSKDDPRLTAPTATKLSMFAAVDDDRQRQVWLMMYDPDGKPLGKIVLRTFEEATEFIQCTCKDLMQVWPREFAGTMGIDLKEPH